MSNRLQARDVPPTTASITRSAFEPCDGALGPYTDGRTVTGREVYAMDYEGKELKALRYYVGDLAFLDSGT